MASPRVLCLGEALLDRVGVSASSGAIDYPGGAPANVACGLAKLGTASAFLGCLGADEPGQQLLAQFEQAGVDVSGVVYQDSAPTRIVEVELKDGDRRFVGFAGGAADSFADAQLQASSLPAELFIEADCLVLGSNALAYPQSAAAVQRAIELANEHFVKIVLDVNWRPVFWPDSDDARAEAKTKIADLAQQVDFLKLSDSDAQWLYGETKASVILTQIEQLEAVLVTAGADGTDYAFRTGARGHGPAFRVAVQDTTGAGDAFVAGLVHQLVTQGLQGLKTDMAIAQAIRYANAAGSLATTGWGAIAPQASDAEIQAFLVGRVE